MSTVVSGEVRLDLDVRALDPLVRPLIEQRVARAAVLAGEGFRGDVKTTDRPHGAVRAVTRQARRANARDNRLLKAVWSS